MEPLVLEKVLENQIGCQVSIYNMQFDFIPVEGTIDVNVIMRQAWGSFFRFGEGM